MSTARAAIPAIRHEVVVDASPPDAFAAFTDGINGWWPREYTWSGEQLERVAIEARPGGFAHEIGPQGMRLDWGRISVWEPPRRLALTWHIGPDRVPETNPGRASQVQVTFAPAPGDRTKVTVSHDGWERHGEEGAAYRDAFEAAGAWRRMLEGYAAYASRAEEAPWAGLST